MKNFSWKSFWAFNLKRKVFLLMLLSGLAGTVNALQFQRDRWSWGAWAYCTVVQWTCIVLDFLNLRRARKELKKLDADIETAEYWASQVVAARVYLRQLEVSGGTWAEKDAAQKTLVNAEYRWHRDAVPLLENVGRVASKNKPL